MRFWSIHRSERVHRLYLFSCFSMCYGISQLLDRSPAICSPDFKCGSVRMLVLVVTAEGILASRAGPYHILHAKPIMTGASTHRRPRPHFFQVTTTYRSLLHNHRQPSPRTFTTRSDHYKTRSDYQIVTRAPYTYQNHILPFARCSDLAANPQTSPVRSRRTYEKESQA
jgi:hypothetical protein